MKALTSLLLFIPVCLAVLVTGEHRASACSPAITDVDDGWGVTSGVYGDGFVIPRNYGYVRGDIGARVAITNSPFALYRDGSSLPVGPRLMGMYNVLVEDVVDEVPPSGPVLSSGTVFVQKNDGQCYGAGARSLTVRFEDAGSDDHTPTNGITYALFTGTSKNDLDAATTPTRFLRTSSLPSGEREIYLFGPDPNVRWVSIAAIDLAGNVSPRSNAIELTNQEVEAAADDGDTPSCSASPARSGAPNMFVGAVAVVTSMLARRRQRRGICLAAPASGPDPGAGSSFRRREGE